MKTKASRKTRNEIIFGSSRNAWTRVCAGFVLAIVASVVPVFGQAQSSDPVPRRVGVVERAPTGGATTPVFSSYATDPVSFADGPTPLVPMTMHEALKVWSAHVFLTRDETGTYRYHACYATAPDAGPATTVQQTRFERAIAQGLGGELMAASGPLRREFTTIIYAYEVEHSDAEIRTALANWFSDYLASSLPMPVLQKVAQAAGASGYAMLPSPWTRGADCNGNPWPDPHETASCQSPEWDCSQPGHCLATGCSGDPTSCTVYDPDEPIEHVLDFRTRF